MKNVSLSNNSQYKKDEGNPVLYILLALFGFFLIIVAGGVAAYGDMTLVLIFLGLISGVIFITQPRLSLWIVLIGGTIISGLTEIYFPNLQQVRWGIALLSMALMPISIFSLFFSSSFSLKKISSDNSKLANKFLLVCVVFFSFSLISTLANMTGFTGLKNYFQLFGFAFALVVFSYNPEDVTKFMRFILFLGVIQLPFVFHQFIALVPLRSTLELAYKNVVAIDIVAGTFGGEMFGGGKSSVLALLSSLGMVLIFAQWRVGQKKSLSVFSYFIIFFIPMLLCEAKLFIFLFLIGLALLFGDKILESPIKFVVIGLFCIGLNLGVLFSITLLPGAESQKTASFDQLIEETLAYNTGNKGYGGAVLNRTTVYPFWWLENVERGDYVGTLVGHGPGCTNSAGLDAKNLASMRYLGYGIDLTAISSLLWEVGILGTCSVLLGFFLIYQLGSRLAHYWRGSDYWSYIKTAQIGVLSSAISLFHNNYFNFEIGFQTLVMLLSGYLIAMSRFTLEDKQ